MNRLIQFKPVVPPFLISLVLACFGLLPQMQALPPEIPGNPDGCYPAFTTAEGCSALALLGSGIGNTAIGWYSLFSDGDASFNTGVGAGALALTTTGANNNTAVGTAAMLLNTSGHDNTAVGTDALLYNDSGSYNSAVGVRALYSNIDGTNNSAFGHVALFYNIRASGNTAIGDSALLNNDITGNGLGIFNTAVGVGALIENTDGVGNVAVGTGAGGGITTGIYDVAVGFATGTGITTGTNIIAIGAFVSGVSTGLGEISNSCYIGNIHGQPFDPGGAPAFVQVDADGKLGTIPSSWRFKKDIKPMNQASEALLALTPVTFHYNYDKKDTPQFGLIAQEVEEVKPDLVTRDKEGKLYSVRYDQVNAMLLNEFLKEHRKVEKQQKEIDALKAELKEQRTLIQEVSDKVELNKLALQTIVTNQ